MEKIIIVRLLDFENMVNLVAKFFLHVWTSGIQRRI